MSLQDWLKLPTAALALTPITLSSRLLLTAMLVFSPLLPTPWPSLEPSA